MRRFSISTDVIRNPLVSHHAIYLYITLKEMMDYRTYRVDAYSANILKNANWSDRRTLKKYLSELKQIELITYEFVNFPINKPLLITINPIPDDAQFTQVDELTIKKINDVTWDHLIMTNIDMKEMAIRLFYLYESYYNSYYEIAFPSFRVINSDTRISNIYIKLLNELFNKNKLVIVKYGSQVEWNKKGNNTYIPICDRKTK